MLRNGAGGERPRRSNEDEVLFGVQPMRPSPASLILQPPTTGSRLEGNASKWERSVPMNPMIGSAVQYASRGSHFVPFVRQASSNRFKDTNVAPSVISQPAADEGSIFQGFTVVSICCGPSALHMKTKETNLA